MTQDEVLKPCPFCGSPAELDTRRGYRVLLTGKSGHGIAVYCTQCSADMMLCAEDIPDIEPQTLIDMWNRRVGQSVAKEPVMDAETMETVLAPNELGFVQTLTGTAAFIRSNYADLGKAEAEVIARKLEIAADTLNEDGRLLVRASRQLGKWYEFFGKHGHKMAMLSALPPAGDVELQEDINKALLPAHQQPAPSKEPSKLYAAMNEMMAALGCHGTISSRDDRVQAVMDALHDIDGGTVSKDAQYQQLPPLTDLMYHAVRGSEYHFTSGGESSVVGYLDDDCLDEIWENINTALRVAAIAAQGSHE